MNAGPLDTEPMNVLPTPLRWTIATLHFFSIANLAAGTMLMLTGHGLTQALVELYPVFQLLAKGWVQVSCIAILLTSALLCEVAVYALTSRRSWGRTFSLVLLLVISLGWSAGGLSLLVAGVGLYGLLQSRSRIWLTPQAQDVPVVLSSRPKTLNLD